MKYIIALLASVSLVFPGSVVFGATMMGDVSNDHTAKEEAEGKEIWQKLQDKITTCPKLTDDDFEALGEYFMGQMMGTAHEAMNLMMTRMMGETGEKQMHIVMGERLSGCNTAATFSPSVWGYMPMMQMMWGGWGNMMGNWNNPWSYSSWGFYGLLTTLTWIGLLVLLFLAIVKLWRSINKDKNKND